jgi:hypothetical protein
MSVPGPAGRMIAVIDVQDVGPATALTAARFRELQARQAPGGDPKRVDFTRVVLLDDIGDYASHHDAYVQILDFRVKISLLCVVIGQGSHADSAVALRRPYQLRGPKAATLWVGDRDGIDWRMDSSQAEAVYPCLLDPRGPYRGLARDFVESLRTQEVFDEVLKGVGKMPGAAASPGTYVSRDDVDPTAISQAQRAAAKRLAGTSPPPGARAPTMEPERLLPGRAGSAAPADPVLAGGELDQLYQRSQRAVNEVVSAAAHLAWPGKLLAGDGGRARSALARLAKAMPELVAAIASTLEEVDPREAFDATQADELHSRGIELKPPRPQDPPVAVDALSELTVTALDQGQPLGVIAGLLRDLADRLVPEGTQPYLARLRRICPEAALGRLTSPPSILAGALSGWLLAWTVLGGLLAGLWPAPLALSGVLYVLGAIGVAAMIRSRAATVARAVGPTGWRFVGAQSAAAVAGAGCGIAVSRIAALPTPSGPAAIGAGIAVVLVVVLMSVEWSVLIRRWVRASGLSGLPRVVKALRGLVTEAATQEWELAAERRAASDFARIMAGMVDDVAAGLKSHAADALHGQDQPGAWAAEEAGQPDAGRQDEIQTLVLLDLSAVAATVLSQLFTALGAGRLVTVDAETVRRPLEAQLAVYAEHLAAVGIYEPPPFERGSRQRPALVDSLLERSVRLEQLIWSDVQDDRIVQLCAPEHLALLEVDPTAAELIKFFPQSGQEVAGRTLSLSAAQSSDIQWSPASGISGLLRLVPLRPGAVEEVWPVEGGNPDE